MPELPKVYPEGIPLDLSRPTEATRRELYDRLVRLQSTPDPEEPEPIPFDPDAAGLVIFHVFGRWFATWTDMEAPADAPEHQRRELVRIQPAATPDGFLLYEV
jgi:hypothetical protein